MWSLTTSSFRSTSTTTDMRNPNRLTRVVGIGAGGHAKVVLEILRLIGSFELVGLLDRDRDLWNTQVLGVPVLGDDDILSELKQQGVNHAFLGVGSIGNWQPRKRLYDELLKRGFQIVPAIHPHAVISPSAAIGTGPTVMAGVLINASAILGNNVIINTGAVVEHDCIVGDHAHIATGARLAGNVLVGMGTHVGAGATVREFISIGEGAIVGAGAVVVKDVAAGKLAIGVPARPVQRPNEKNKSTNYPAP